MYLHFNLRIPRFSTIKMSSLAHNTDDGGGGDDDNAETALALLSVVSFSVKKGE